jgi:hypothetical protein
MNQIFAHMLRKHVLVLFLDDVLIYNKTLGEHAQHLEQVFQILDSHQFLVKLSKCEFAKQQLEYLGLTISAQGVATESSKIEAIA